MAENNTTPTLKDTQETLRYLQKLPGFDEFKALVLKKLREGYSMPDIVKAVENA